MLRDAPIAPQPSDLPRRWMADDYFDLIVWYEATGQVHGFQLCYEKGRHERALTWIRTTGFHHSRVDTGEALPTDTRAPVLIPGGTFPSALVREQFARRSIHLSPEIRKLVASKLAQFARSRRRWCGLLPVVTAVASLGFVFLVWRAKQRRAWLR